MCSLYLDSDYSNDSEEEAFRFDNTMRFHAHTRYPLQQPITEKKIEKMITPTLVYIPASDFSPPPTPLTPVAPSRPAPSKVVSVQPEETSIFRTRPHYEYEDPMHECLVDNCHQTYRRKNDLKNHILCKHIKVPDILAKVKEAFPPRQSRVGKSFPCTYASCPSGYFRKSDLARHLRNVHGHPTLPLGVAPGDKGLDQAGKNEEEKGSC